MVSSHDFPRVLKLVSETKVTPELVYDILCGADRITSSTKRFFPGSAEAFEFLTVVIEFCELGMKQFSSKRIPKDFTKLKELLETTLVLYPIAAINEYFGLVASTGQNA